MTVPGPSGENDGQAADALTLLNCFQKSTIMRLVSVPPPGGGRMQGARRKSCRGGRLLGVGPAHGCVQSGDRSGPLPAKRLDIAGWTRCAHESAERRAQSAERRAQSAERRAQSAERRAQSAERRAQSAERRAQSAERRAQSAERRAQSAERRAQSAERRAQSAERRAQSAERRAQSAERRAQSVTLPALTEPPAARSVATPASVASWQGIPPRLNAVGSRVAGLLRSVSLSSWDSCTWQDS